MNEPVTVWFDDVDGVVQTLFCGAASFAILFSVPTSIGRAVRRGIILSLTPSLRRRVDIADTVLRERPVAATTSAMFALFCQFFTNASYEYGALDSLPLVLDMYFFWHSAWPQSRATLVR